MKFRIGIVALSILLMGAIRLPLENSLTSELREAKLLTPPLEIGTTEKIGQTSAAVALGGLRTLVATFLNLRAFTFFTEVKWDQVHETYQLIVDLAPRTPFYWDTGAWHQTHNAAAYYIRESDLPSLRRREAWRASIHRGRTFLERGIRNNPDDWVMQNSLGFLLTDANKFTAFSDVHQCFEQAAEAYEKAVATGNAPGYVKRNHFFALARIPGREAEALELGNQLYDESRRNRLPTLLSLKLVLEAHQTPDLDVASRAVELFGTPERAYTHLSGHWQRTRERYPVYGVARALEDLEKILNTPAEKSILSQPLPPPKSLDDWFE